MLLNNPTKDERKEFNDVVGDIEHKPVGPFETVQPNFNTFRRAKSDSTIAENLGDSTYAAESKAKQLSNFPKDAITKDDIQTVRNKMGHWGNEVGDNTMAEFSNSLGLKEDIMKAADPEHNDYDDDYNWDDTNKYNDVFNVFNGQEGTWLEKANKIRDILKGNGNLSDKAKEIKNVAPETDAHKEGDDIKLSNGNTVEDALEQSTSVKDTDKEDKTQAEEKEMAGLLGRARPKGLLGAGILSSRDGVIPGDMSEHADLPIRKVKPNSDPDSQRLGLNFTDEDRLNWNNGKDRKVGDYTLDEWNTKDKLQNALEEGDKAEVENIVEENPVEAEKALKDDSPLNEEAEQVDDGDKRTDEVNNEAVEEAIKNPEDQLENSYGKGMGDGWNNGYVDDFDPNGPDFVSNDDTVSDSANNKVEDVPEQPEVVDSGLEDQNQYQDSVDEESVKEANEESVESVDNTIIDEEAPDVEASKWEQLSVDQKKVDKLNEALYKKQQEIERQDLLVDQLRSYMEENPKDFETAEKLEREELKAEQLYNDKEKLEKELETTSTPEVRLREEPEVEEKANEEPEEETNEFKPHEASLNYSGAHRVSNTPFSSGPSKVNVGPSRAGVGSKLLGNVGHYSGIHAPSVSGPHPVQDRPKGSTANRALPVGGKVDLNGAANNRTSSIPNRSNSEGAGHTMFGVAAMMKPLYRTNMTIKVGETQLPNMSGGHTAEPEALNPEVQVSGGHTAYTTHSAIADIKQRILTKYPGGIVTNGLSIEVNENGQVTVNGTPLAKVPQEVLKKVEEIL